VETSPVKVITWRDLAERCAQEIKKGDLVAVDGRLQINNYTGSDGLKKRDVEVDAIAVENLSNTGSGSDAKADLSEGRLATSGARATKQPGSDPNDLDAIFASEDEIPF
jgi:single-strand DNA-binding protein